MRGEMRSADIPWQEQAGAHIYNLLKPVNDWSKRRGADSGIQGLGIGALVEALTSGLMEPAQQAATGTPNVYYDATSENPLNWQAKPPLAELALTASDLVSPGTGSAALLGVKRIPKLWHGIVSTRTGIPSDMNKLIREGYRAGRSAEMSDAGASLSRDPMVSLIGFTDRLDEYAGPYQVPGSPDPRLTNPAQMLTADVHAKPEEVYNIPPDFLLGKVKPEPKGAMYNLPNFALHEAETFARVPKGKAAPSASPRNPTENEMRYLEKEARTYDKQHSIYADMMGRRNQVDPVTREWSEHPTARTYRDEADMGRKYVETIAAMRGNVGQFDHVVDNLARKITPLRDGGGYFGDERIRNAVMAAAGPEGQYLEAAANMLRDARRYKEELIYKLGKNRGARAGIEPKESLDSVMARASGDLNSVGSPSLRQAWRDDVTARNAFYDELYNSVFKMKK
jgi:hypothetical protein